MMTKSNSAPSSAIRSRSAPEASNAGESGLTRSTGKGPKIAGAVDRLAKGADRSPMKERVCKAAVIGRNE